MVWMAIEVAWAIDLDEQLMGITVLAAGTSVPDALSSLAVAKQGYGDMAFASAVGSNVFDFGIGLPVPWIFYIALRNELGHGLNFVPLNSPNLWVRFPRSAGGDAPLAHAPLPAEPVERHHPPLYDSPHGKGHPALEVAAHV